MLIEFSLDTDYFQASGFLFHFTTQAKKIKHRPWRLNPLY